MLIHSGLFLPANQKILNDSGEINSELGIDSAATSPPHAVLAASLRKILRFIPSTTFISAHILLVNNRGDIQRHLRSEDSQSIVM